MATMQETDLEDIMENVIAKLYTKYKTLEIDNILAYVYRMLDNEIKDFWKKKYKESAVYSDEEVYAQEYIQPGESVEEVIINEDLLNKIGYALRKLRSEKKKKLFELKLKGYSSIEIMNKMGLSRSAYDTIVFRATQDLKNTMSKIGIL
jgi:RNA polymerase sigma factor (sigma-70 family)